MHTIQLYIYYLSRDTTSIFTWELIFFLIHYVQTQENTPPTQHTTTVTRDIPHPTFMYFTRYHLGFVPPQLVGYCS